MVEAPNSVQQAKLRAKMHMATYVLARQAAIKATKHRLQAQGLRVAHISHREIMRAADAYLDQHRAELTAAAKPIVEQWRAQGFFGRKAQRADLTNVTSDEQGGKA